MIILGSILFTFAFNFKIMSLYYLYPFLAFVAGKAAISTGLRSRHRLSLNLRRIPYFLFYMMTILLTVILTSCIIWYPWIWDKDLFKSVFRAIFPIHRGLYQLPVGTFWCFSNTFLKWRNYFTNP